MKISILYPMREQPFGGPNQFLKALRTVWRENGIFEERVGKSDAVIFNLNPVYVLKKLIKQVDKLKRKNPRLVVIGRIDGPTHLMRGFDRELDEVFILFIHAIADGVIFQSQWSKSQMLSMGLIDPINQLSCLNAPDDRFFFFKPKCPAGGLTREKWKIIATSWSFGAHKGFDVYQWLDNQLDFSRYDVTFVGNSPVTFKNIKHIPPLKSAELGNIMRKHDIYLTASKCDPCSNALIEALHCGLPAIAYDDGGHGEIVRQAGRLFSKKEEIDSLLKEVIADYVKFQSKIKLPSIDNVANRYYSFIETLVDKTRTGKYQPKEVGQGDLLTMFDLIKKSSIYETFPQKVSSSMKNKIRILLKRLKIN